MSVDAVKSRLHRARIAIREALAPTFQSVRGLANHTAWDCAGMGIFPACAGSVRPRMSAFGRKCGDPRRGLSDHRLHTRTALSGDSPSYGSVVHRRRSS